MAPYNTYGTYYDPVGSQSNQPQGYTYANQQQQQQPTATPSTNSQYTAQTGSNYQSNYGQNYNNTSYGTQQYGTTSQQPQASSTATRAAASSALNAMNTQNYTQPASDTRSSNNTAQYDSSYYSSAGYASMNNRSQANESPLYATNSGDSTFGRLSLPAQSQSQSTSNPFGTSQNYQAPASNASTQSYRNAPSSARAGQQKYQTAYTQPQTQQQPPQRYASPLQAVQAQHQSHNKQSSRASNHAPSPQMAARNAQQQHIQQQHQRQSSASVEPSPTTVDPSQVYDMRAEQQRKAQVDAEKRRKAEAQRKAEEQARAAEEAARKAEEDRKAEAERIEREAREAHEAEEAAKAEEEAAKKRAAQDRKNEQRRKAREEKRQSKTAATALTQMASAQVGSSSSADAAMAAMVGDMSQPPANAEEAEMRAMFKKMREFNAKNPALLSKLWEEERKAHASVSGAPPANTSQATAPPVAAPAPAKQPAAPKNATPATTPASAQKGNQQVRPFKQPIPAKSAPPPVVAPVQQTNAQLWPTDQKGPIAETATVWLNNYPRNQASGRMVRKEEIHKLLDANPSYVQLCESLEAQGVRLDRSLFAKELLKAMPKDSRNSQSTSKAAGAAVPAPGIAAQMNGAAAPAEPAKKNKGGRPKKDGPLTYSVPQNHTNRSHPGGVAYQAPTFTSLADAAREVNQMGVAPGFPTSASGTLASAITGHNSPFQTPAQTPALGEASSSNGRPPSQSQVPDVKSESVPPEPQRPPADKEEAARKRTFNDLVDLTKGEESDDDEAPPRKIQQTFSGPPTGAMNPPPLNDHVGRPNLSQYIRHTPHFLNSMPGPGVYTPPSRQSHWARPAIPVPQAPVVPSQLQPKPRGPTEEQKQQERLRGKMLVEPIMRDRVARKSRYDSRTIARDVLLATGRHPDMRALNSHLNSMQKILGDHGGVVDNAGNKSDLATIRWDIVDPGEPAEEAKAKIKTAAASRGEAFAQGTSGAAAIDAGEETEDADDESDEASARPAAISNADREAEVAGKLKQLREIATEEELSQIDDPRIWKTLSSRLQQQRKSGEGGSSGYPTNAKRGPGRPPKRPSAAVATASSDFTLETDITPRNTNNKARATPAKSNNSTPAPKGSAGSPMSGAVGYAAFRQVDADGNTVKRKGRPIGWRKSIHSREAQGLTPAKSGGYKPVSPASRLRKPKDASKAEALVTPQYQVYKCRWQGCTSELDNLERLKKHLVKLHGAPNPNGEFECRWPKCPSAGKHMDANGDTRHGNGEVSSFESIEHWLKHISKEHLEEVAWKLGDGPKGGSVSDQHTDSESYLSDSHGRSVTPVILSPAELAKSESPTRTSNIPKFKTSVGPTSKAEREAREEFQQLVDRKRLEGATMGREGCKLAIDTRRCGFLDDEDFEDVISEDDTS